MSRRCPSRPALPLRPGPEHEALLGRLLPLWPHELTDWSRAGRERRVALLRTALRAERQRGVAGHWTYDLARHTALLACFRTETAALEAARSARGKTHETVGGDCPRAGRKS